MSIPNTALVSELARRATELDPESDVTRRPIKKVRQTPNDLALLDSPEPVISRQW